MSALPTLCLQSSTAFAPRAYPNRLRSQRLAASRLPTPCLQGGALEVLSVGGLARCRLLLLAYLLVEFLHGLSQ